jgi:hypothetical protein
LLTLLLGVGGCWILPTLLLVWLVRKPADRVRRDFPAAATPGMRRRQMRLSELMLLVLMVSVDVAITAAMTPRDFAFILVAADLAIIGLTVVIATFVALTPAQFAAVVVSLAIIALVTIWRLLLAMVI